MGDEKTKVERDAGAFVKLSRWQRLEMVLDLLSKPVSLAIISGLIITLLTTSVQTNSNRQENEREYLRAMREKKLQLLGAFDVAFNNSLSSGLWYDEKSAWIESYKDRKLHPRGPNEFPGGLPEFNRMIDDLEAKWLARAAMPTYGALFAQVDSVFESQDVRTRLAELREEVARHPPNEGIAQTLHRVQAKITPLLSAMGNEIREGGTR